eukprot:6374447-Pyramimonas_sp.AAC.1
MKKHRAMLNMRDGLEALRCGRGRQSRGNYRPINRSRPIRDGRVPAIGRRIWEDDRPACDFSLWELWQLVKIADVNE